MHTPPHILIVDDEVSARNTIEALLYPDGYQLAFAASGQAALARLEVEPPDVVLLDVMMPEMDGFELCQRLKGDKRWQHIPIILVTALDSKKEVVRGLDSGADEFLVKPVNGLELRARVRSMLRVKKQYDDLATMIQLREDLANMIVHDMRSPLVAILGFSELLLAEAPLSLQSRSDVEKIHEQAYRLHDFTQDLLLLAKMEEGRLVLNYTPVDVCRLIQQVQEIHQAVAKPKRIKLVTHLPVSEPPPVLLDSTLFRRVVDNLLANALKFSPADSTIILQLEYPDLKPASDLAAGVRFRVIDEGPGIAIEDRERIFNKFEIADLKRKGVPQVGLGLAFCKLVVETHHGRIFVEPNQPQGSIFTIEI